MDIAYTVVNTLLPLHRNEHSEHSNPLPVSVLRMAYVVRIVKSARIANTGNGLRCAHHAVRISRSTESKLADERRIIHLKIG